MDFEQKLREAYQRNGLAGLKGMRKELLLQLHTDHPIKIKEKSEGEERIEYIITEEMRAAFDASAFNELYEKLKKEYSTTQPENPTCESKEPKPEPAPAPTHESTPEPMTYERMNRIYGLPPETTWSGMERTSIFSLLVELAYGIETKAPRAMRHNVRWLLSKVGQSTLAGLEHVYSLCEGRAIAKILCQRLQEKDFVRWLLSMANVTKYIDLTDSRVSRSVAMVLLYPQFEALADFLPELNPDLFIQPRSYAWLHALLALDLRDVESKRTILRDYQYGLLNKRVQLYACGLTHQVISEQLTRDYYHDKGCNLKPFQEFLLSERKETPVQRIARMARRPVVFNPRQRCAERLQACLGPVSRWDQFIDMLEKYIGPQRKTTATALKDPKFLRNLKVALMATLQNLYMHGVGAKEFGFRGRISECLKECIKECDRMLTSLQHQNYHRIEKVARNCHVIFSERYIPVDVSKLEALYNSA